MNDAREVVPNASSTAFYVNDLDTARLQAYSIDAADVSAFSPLGSVVELYDTSAVTNGYTRSIALNSKGSYLLAAVGVYIWDFPIDAQPNELYSVKVNEDGSLDPASVSSLVFPDGTNTRFLAVTPRQVSE